MLVRSYELVIMYMVYMKSHDVKCLQA